MKLKKKIENTIFDCIIFLGLALIFMMLTGAPQIIEKIFIK